MPLKPEKTNPFFALLLISVCLIGALGTWFSATVILSELTVRTGLGESQQVWLTNAVQLGFVLGAVLIAFTNLSDTMSLTLLIALSCTLAALANLLLLWTDTPFGIITLRFLTGAALSGVYPPVVKLIATWFQKGRGIAMGIIIGALTVGSATPHLFRAISTEANWMVVIWTSSLTTFLAGLIFLFYISEGPFAFARTRFDPLQIIQVLRSKSLNLVNVGYVGHMWELYAMWAWILTFARFSEQSFEVFLFGTPEYFSFFIISIGAIGCLIAGRLSDVYGRCYTTAMLMLVSGTCAFSIGFLVDISPVLFTAVALLWGMTIVADSGQFSTAVTELSEPHLVGTALTFQMALGFAITVITIWLVPIAAQSLGSFQWAFLFLAPGPFIGAIAMLLLRQRPEAEKLALGRR
ncbi:MAG: MFS transporter [Pseudomonadota bacterium]|nr:MAG: MFS transporter [Pseudomonadota bacterium]